MIDFKDPGGLSRQDPGSTDVRRVRLFRGQDTRIADTAGAVEPGPYHEASISSRVLPLVSGTFQAEK